MTIVACPRCTDQVVMPATASPRATVRCPLCQVEFALAEVFERLPPALIVVSDPDAVPLAAPAPTAALTTAAGADAEAVILAGEPDGAEAEPAEWSLAPAIAVADRSGGGDATAAPARARKVIRRPQRKPRNAAVEGVKVILGGLAGLCFAQLVLWWLPVNYRKDPFHWGPQVAQYAPWIVPLTFHGKSVANGEPAALAEEPSRPAKKVNPKPAPAKPKPEDSGLPQIQFKDSIELPDGGKSEPAATAKPANPFDQPDTAQAKPEPEPDFSPRQPAPADEEKPDLASLAPEPLGGMLPKPDLPMGEEPEIKVPAVETPAVKPAAEEPAPETPADAGAAATRKPPLKAAPEVTVADFKTALDEAKIAAGVWQAAELSDKKSLAQSYRALTRLAETLALAEQVAAEDTAVAQELLKSLAKHTAKFDFVAEVVPLWVPAAKRPNNGVVLIGVVKSIRQQGELYETQLETAADGATFVLLSNFDPAASCPVDARILASGVIIPKPAEELNGYQGQAAPAVWLGTTATIAAP